MSAADPDRGEVAVYAAPDGSVRLEVRLERDSVWLTQRHIAELMDTSTDNVGLHLKNIYAEGELDQAATTEESSVVQVEGRPRLRRRYFVASNALASSRPSVSARRRWLFEITATESFAPGKCSSTEWKPWIPPPCHTHGWPACVSSCRPMP